MGPELVLMALDRYLSKAFLSRAMEFIKID